MKVVFEFMRSFPIFSFYCGRCLRIGFTLDLQRNLLYQIIQPMFANRKEYNVFYMTFIHTLVRVKIKILKRKIS